MQKVIGGEQRKEKWLKTRKYWCQESWRFKINKKNKKC